MALHFDNYIYREDGQKIFEAHHAKLKAEKIESLKEKLENKRKGRSAN